MKLIFAYTLELTLLIALSAGCSQNTPESENKNSPAKTQSTSQSTSQATSQSTAAMTDSTPESSPPTGKQSVTPPAASLEITVVELKAAFDNNEDFILLDVRTDSEFQQGHLDNTYALIPHEEVLSRLDELPADKEMYIYCFCRSGRRSGLATSQLRQAGYVHAYNVVGGILAWAGAGYPLDKK